MKYVDRRLVIPISRTPENKPLGRYPIELQSLKINQRERDNDEREKRPRTQHAGDREEFSAVGTVLGPRNATERNLLGGGFWIKVKKKRWI